jgi:hypothetical protein
LAIFSQGSAFIRGVPESICEDIQVDLRFGTESKTASPGEGARKKYRRFALIVLKIRTQLYTCPAPDTKILIKDVFNQFAGSKNMHAATTST